MDIKLLTDVEKASIGERQPLPERYLRLSDDEMDERITAAKKTLGDRVVILSNGGFGGIHGKLLAALDAPSAVSP